MEEGRDTATVHGHDYELIAPDQEGRGEYFNDAAASFQATINRSASKSRIPSATMFNVAEMTMPDAGLICPSQLVELPCQQLPPQPFQSVQQHTTTPSAEAPYPSLDFATLPWPGLLSSLSTHTSQTLLHAPRAPIFNPSQPQPAHAWPASISSSVPPVRVEGARGEADLFDAIRSHLRPERDVNAISASSHPGLGIVNVGAPVSRSIRDEVRRQDSRIACIHALRGEHRHPLPAHPSESMSMWSDISGNRFSPRGQSEGFLPYIEPSTLDRAGYSRGADLHRSLSWAAPLFAPPGGLGGLSSKGGPESPSGRSGEKSTSDPSDDNETMKPDLRKKKRQESNRKSARRTRLRRTQKLQELERQNAALVADKTAISKQFGEAMKLAQDLQTANEQLHARVAALESMEGKQKDADVASKPLGDMKEGERGSQ